MNGRRSISHGTVAMLASVAIVAASLALSGQPAAAASLQYPVINADGGIYYRNSPHWGDTSQTPGVGVYNGDQVRLICGAWGDAVGPYSNRWWHYVTNLTRPSIGNGWVNDHFVNTPNSANQPTPGEPVCGSASSAPANTPPAPGSDQSSASANNGGVGTGSIDGSSGSSGGALPPAARTAGTQRAQATVNGVNVGFAQDGIHAWGPCTVQDFKGGPYDWVIVSYRPVRHLVRNGMLFGWFDNGGAPGRLGCPTTDEYSYQNGVRQDFQNGSEIWLPGMNHAAWIDQSREAAMRWAWSHVNTHFWPGLCLQFVAYSYINGQHWELHGPYGNSVRAIDWWTSPRVPGARIPGIQIRREERSCFGMPGPHATDPVMWRCRSATGRSSRHLSVGTPTCMCSRSGHSRGTTSGG